MANRVVSSTGMASARHDHKSLQALQRLNCGLAIALALLTSGTTIMGYALYDPQPRQSGTPGDFIMYEESSAGVPGGGAGGGNEPIPTTNIKPTPRVAPTPRTTRPTQPRRSPNQDPLPPAPPSPTKAEPPRTTQSPIG